MDLVLRGAQLVDGTGGAARPADVGVAGNKIVAVTAPGELAANGAQTMDLTGLVLAPGFIDIHTHYDAQILWDPDLTPSCWHGVTTVVMGNCGFGIAPTRTEHRDTIVRTLENVEGMSAEALEAGVEWSFETFPEYLDALDRIHKRLNVGAMIGHTPLRLYVLGDESIERSATDEEIATMRRIVDEAILAGALGFATSRAPTHSGAGGKPVPSRLAEPDEVFAIADALRERKRGIIQVTPGPGLFLDQLARLSIDTGRPVTWTALLTGMGTRGTATGLLDQTSKLGGEVWPQIACRKLVMQVALSDPFPFAMQPSFKEILAAPRSERAAIYANPAWRDRARGESSGMWGNRWDKTIISESDRHVDLIGRGLAEVAEERGADPFDLMCDLSVEDDLKTRFTITLLNDDEVELADLLRDKRTVLGLSDAGAHASQLCDACFSTHLLGYWVREQQAITLEQAVWRLTGQPADVFRLGERGRVIEGYVADLVAFDPATVGAGPPERVWDFPNGADRLVVRSTGVEHMWVGGVATRLDGKDVDDARAGVLIRG